MKSNKYTVPFAIITSLFFLWGFITVLVDSLIPRLKDVFELSYFEAGLVQFAFFLAYLLLSIPAGLILTRIGYQKGVVLGLSTMAIACLLFYPAAGERIFGLFMLAYFTLAGGMTILQVAANPYVAVLGDESKASSRLNLAQAFNSVGTTIAPIAGAAFLLSDSIKTQAEIDVLDEVAQMDYYISEASAVQGPFLWLAAAIGFLVLFFIVVPLPKIIKDHPQGGYKEVLQNRKTQLGALGIFLYVGAEVAIGSYLVSYFLDMNLVEPIRESQFMNWIASIFSGGNLQSIDGKAVVGSFVFIYWGGAMLGRFIGSLLTNVLSPSKVLAGFAVMAVLMVVISMSTAGLVSMFAILSVGLFNSIIFPTIFSLTLEGQGDLKPRISGVLCTAIFGGALISPLFGALADGLGFKLAFLLPIACYGYVWWFARRSRSAA
ncbi:sugar MFS transporter [Cryomorphaceae bacterium 1068]|nr:sugar MFS transporter [Cryomorphaceae bacterium 1068]